MLFFFCPIPTTIFIIFLSGRLFNFLSMIYSFVFTQITKTFDNILKCHKILGSLKKDKIKIFNDKIYLWMMIEMMKILAVEDVLALSLNKFSVGFSLEYFPNSW